MTPQSVTLLDVIVTNTRDTVIHKDIIQNVTADHDLITAAIDTKKQKRAAPIKIICHMGAYSKDAFCNAVLSYASALNNIYRTDDKG